MSAGYTQESQNLLQQYLDGELAESAHAGFFSELSVNEAMRRDFSIMMSVRDELRRDMITPPVNSEAEVIGAMRALAPIPPVTILSLRLKSGLVGVSIGVLVTCLLFWFNGTKFNQGQQTTFARAAQGSQTDHAANSDGAGVSVSENSLSKTDLGSTGTSASYPSSDNSASVNEVDGAAESSRGKHDIRHGASATAQHLAATRKGEATGFTARSAGSNNASSHRQPRSLSPAQKSESILAQTRARMSPVERQHSSTVRDESTAASSISSLAESAQQHITKQSPNGAIDLNTSTSSTVNPSSQTAGRPNDTNGTAATATQSNASALAANSAVAHNPATEVDLGASTIAASGAASAAHSVGMQQTVPPQRRLAVEFRSFSMKSYPDVNLGSLSQPPINNVALSLMSALNDEHALGVEIGQESVLQRYGATMNARPVTVEQNTLAWWLSALYEFAPSGLRISDLQPFGRVTLGATRIGPMGRMLMGVRYYVLENVGLSLSAEGMQMMSWQDGSTVSSAKLGFSGGLCIRF